ncbi:MAG: hypothetical protein EOM20_15940 [Spartobacteria bacterium]|nr:hypothetical protein [Spartobacteria bacterium]
MPIFAVFSLKMDYFGIFSAFFTEMAVSRHFCRETCAGRCARQGESVQQTVMSCAVPCGRWSLRTMTLPTAWLPVFPGKTSHFSEFWLSAGCQEPFFSHKTPISGCFVRFYPRSSAFTRG